MAPTRWRHRELGRWKWEYRYLVIGGIRASESIAGDERDGIGRIGRAGIEIDVRGRRTTAR